MPVSGVPVPADSALRTAHLRVVKKLLSTERDADRRATLQRVIA